MANNGQKSLSQVFRELEQNRNQYIAYNSAVKKEREQKSFMFHVKHRTKKDNIVLILIVLIVLMVFSLFSSNYIFATDINLDEEKVAIGQFEKNDNPIDVYEIISKNISNTYQKEVFDREEEIKYQTEYISNKDLPKDETNIIQEGSVGNKTVTYVRSYENGEITEETSIGEIVNIEPKKEIIEVGTSNILKQYNIHIGDVLYVAENTSILEKCNENSKSLTIVPQYFDVKTVEVIDDCWFKVNYESFTGYILCNYLTSETLTPSIKELSRKAKIFDKVDVEMKLNEKSGLTEDDYKVMLSNQSSDTNNVFKENYKAFYDAEQKYKINGVFLASIAIHESGWGRSSIALNKHNLFGFGAYDASPYESAVTFDSYADGINTVAAWLASKYLNTAGTVLPSGEIATGTYYNGPTVSGVNTRYASDTYWSTKIFSTMENLYAELH